MQPLKNLKRSPTTVSDLAFIFFLISRITAILLSCPCVTDVTLYLDFFIKTWVFELTPYQEFSLEYPPLSLIAISIPGFIANKDLSLGNYYLSFASLIFFIDYCCLQTCKSYCKTRLNMKDREISYMVVLYALFGLIMFRIIYHRLDIIVSMFFIASLMLFKAQNNSLKSSFLNGFLGFFYKIISAFNIPILIIAKAFSKSSNIPTIIREIFVNSLIFLTPIAIAVFALEIYTHHNFINNMLYHQERGIQIESSYGSLLLLKNLLFTDNHSLIYSSFGSNNIAGNVSLEIFAKFFGILVILLFYAAIFFILLNKKRQNFKTNFSEINFLDATLITILLFISFQRVFSTQFILWLIPISAIWLAHNRSIKYLIAFSAIYLGSFFIFSVDYLSLKEEVPILVITLALRNIILIVTTLIITINFLKELTLNDKN